MKIKKLLSLFLATTIIITVISCFFAVTANATGTITYSYVIKSSESVNAFMGKIVYPTDSLSVNTVIINNGGQYNDKNGTVFFNNTNASVPFDFSNGSNIITIVFNVLDDYNKSDISGELSDYYNNNMVLNGNIPFDYSNVIDGETVTCGHTDIDTPSNSYTNTEYTIVYSYKEKPDSTSNSTYTKKAWFNSSNAYTIAELNQPRIDNPYYTNYNVSDASFTSETSISATLSCETKKYTVSFNGFEIGKYSYLDTASISLDEEKDFLVNGNHVATGKSFNFYVIEDTDVTTDNPSGTIGESASLVSNALYISDNPSSPGSAYVKMEMLASATSSDFERMGVAFAISERSNSDLEAAISSITTGTSVNNKIAVHNSKVDMPNQSGQYQFIYAPYSLVTNIPDNLANLYFYTFVVNKNGNIKISNVQQVSLSNVLA